MASPNTTTDSENLQTAESHKEQNVSKQIVKRKSKTTSKVWEVFKKVKVTVPTASGSTIEDEMAECIYCNRKLTCNSKSCGTSGLLYHAEHCRKNPKNSQKSILAYTPPDSSNEGDSVGALKTWNFDQEATRKALAHMIITDELPFRFVERAGFQHFMRAACPLFSIPSRWTVVRDCFMMYDEERLKLKAFIKKSAQRVCLTTDTWTSNQRVNYLCLTAHFIDDKWNLHKRILNFVPISSHRGEDIGVVIEQCLAAWDVEKIFTITMDNAASNNIVAAYLKKKLATRNGCILSGKYLHMRCIAHIVNLIVVDGLKSMKQSISRIRNAVRYVRQSPSRWQKFKECISIEKIESKSSVCTLDVRTRWNSTYLMLESAVKFEAAFDRLDDVDPFFRMELDCKKKGKGVTDEVPFGDEIDEFDENRLNKEDSSGIPNKCDWKNARRFNCFLRHFYTLTVRVSGSRYVTSNTFFTEISNVLYLLEEWQQSEDGELVDMALRMKQKYDKYWGNPKKMNMIIYIAVVLDPRYKLEYLYWTLENIYKSGEKVDNQCEGDQQGDRRGDETNLTDMVKHALYDMFNDYMRTNNCIIGGRKEGFGTSNLMNLNNSENENVMEGSSKLVSLYLMHKSKAQNDENRTELDTYLKEATESLTTEFDILSWWRMHSPRFPILSQMARDILAVPISTVASESAFSTSGRILDAFRSSLTPRLVQSLICAQDWIRSRTSQMYVSVEEDLTEIEKLEEDLMKVQ